SGYWPVHRLLPTRRHGLLHRIAAPALRLRLSRCVGAVRPPELSPPQRSEFAVCRQRLVARAVAPAEQLIATGVSEWRSTPPDPAGDLAADALPVRFTAWDAGDRLAPPSRSKRADDRRLLERRDRQRAGGIVWVGIDGGRTQSVHRWVLGRSWGERCAGPAP